MSKIVENNMSMDRSDWEYVDTCIKLIRSFFELESGTAHIRRRLSNESNPSEGTTFLLIIDSEILNLQIRHVVHWYFEANINRSDFLACGVGICVRLEGNLGGENAFRVSLELLNRPLDHLHVIVLRFHLDLFSESGILAELVRNVRREFWQREGQHNVRRSDFFREACAHAQRHLQLEIGNLFDDRVDTEGSLELRSDSIIHRDEFTVRRLNSQQTT